MPRKSKYVKKITGREEKLFTQLSNTGICDVDQAKKYCNLNRERITKLENSGYILVDKVFIKSGNFIEIVRLGQKGRKYSENILANEYFYKTSLKQVNHDIKLTEVYYTLENVKEWKNETQIKEENKEITKKDCVDAIVTFENNEICAVEVIGSKYTKETIKNKELLGNKLAGKTILR